MFVEKVNSALRLMAVDAKAHKLGLGPGLTLADARARIPHLKAVDMDRDADAVFLERLADFCDRYTPLVGLAGDDGLVLDITGCVHLFGGEAALFTQILEKLKTNGVTALASIAGTPDAAQALARFADPLKLEARIIAPGKDADAVRGLPIHALNLTSDTLNGLSRAGLKTIGGLAEQPRPALAARFGEALTNKLTRTLGERDARIAPRRPLPPCMAEQRFAEPIGLESDILATLGTLAGRTARLLEERGEGGRRFEASLFRADGRVERLAVETGSPMRNPAALLRLFQERLAALADPLDPGFGFDLIRLGVQACTPLEPGQTSLDSTHIAEQELAMLIDRLSTRFGAEAVQRFVPVDSHIPERAVQMRPAIRQEGNTLLWAHPSPHSAPARPLHMFETPQPIETLAEVPDGPPLKFRWRRVLHDIISAEGPERIADEWWHTPAMSRDYYRIEDAHGRRYWVFREGLYGRETTEPRWFLHGIFA